MLHKFEFNGTKIVLDVNSGAVHVMDELSWEMVDDYKKLSREELEAKYISKNFPREDVCQVIDEISELEKQGLLYAEDYFSGDELLLKWPAVVKSICLNIAHDCNLRCKYCFAGTGDFGGGRLLMPLEVGQKAIDFLLEQSANRRHCELDFFGGEPLMNIKTVMELVRYGKEQSARRNKEIKFTLTTNALLLNDEINDLFNRENVSIVLSLDGRPEVHNNMRKMAGTGKGSYDYIMPKITTFINSRPNEDYIVRGTYTRYNLDFSKDVLHLADLGYKHISVEPVVGLPSEEWAITEEDLPRIFDEYEKLTAEYVERMKNNREFDFFHFNLDLGHGPCLPKRLSGCGAGHGYMAVTPDGDLYPCHQFVGRDNFKLGNVWDGIQNTALVEQFRKAHVYNKEKCTNCWAKFHCGGGCHANAELINGDIMKPYDVGCEIEKKRLECAIYIQVLKAGNKES